MERIALKVQRRCYSRAAVYEVAIHYKIQRTAGPGGGIVGLREAFLHDGHVCMAFDRHGRSLSRALRRGPLPPARARRTACVLAEALDRMHRCGYAHTDVKPGNILYDPRTGVACLADLGCADAELREGIRPGTRDYLSPEILLGSPLAPSLDLWSLGCTVFEMLAGAPLFDPWREAGKKYREFSKGVDRVEVPLGEEELRDRAEEKAEQLASGDVVAGKYRVLRVLGGGRFGTVWDAQRISDAVLDGTYDTLWTHAQRTTDAEPPETDRESADHRWRHAKGASDLLELVLNYEHVLLIAALRGAFPPAMIEAARFRASYFESDGALRFRPGIRPASLREKLRRRTTLRGGALDLAEDFLGALLQVDPAARPTAAAALAHPWLAAADFRGASGANLPARTTPVRTREKIRE